MAVTKANTLSDQQLQVLLVRVVQRSKRPLVDKVAFLLSYKAGLRVQEIAGLRWKENVLDSQKKFRAEEVLVPGSKGRIKRDLVYKLFIGSDIGKYATERTVPMHPMLRSALQELRDEGVPSPYVIPSGKQGADQYLKSRANALRVRINRIYAELDFQGCTSHSGRRTFITRAAQRANLVGCSLKDVQVMAGHKDLSTTEMYIDIAPSQGDLVALL
jgi:integrase